MDHSSIQVTVDTYPHLILGANVSFVILSVRPGQKRTPSRPRVASRLRPIPSKLLI